MLDFGCTFLVCFGGVGLTVAAVCIALLLERAPHNHDRMEWKR